MCQAFSAFLVPFVHSFFLLDLSNLPICKPFVLLNLSFLIWKAVATLISATCGCGKDGDNRKDQMT